MWNGAVQDWIGRGTTALSLRVTERGAMHGCPCCVAAGKWAAMGVCVCLSDHPHAPAFVAYPLWLHHGSFPFLPAHSQGREVNRHVESARKTHLRACWSCFPPWMPATCYCCQVATAPAPFPASSCCPTRLLLPVPCSCCLLPAAPAAYWPLSWLLPAAPLACIVGVCHAVLVDALQALLAAAQPRTLVL
jgi:hypothetical protein